MHNLYASRGEKKTKWARIKPIHLNLNTYIFFKWLMRLFWINKWNKYMKPHCKLATGDSYLERKKMLTRTQKLLHLLLCGHVKEGKIKRTFWICERKEDINVYFKEKILITTSMVISQNLLTPMAIIPILPNLNLSPWLSKLWPLCFKPR